MNTINALAARYSRGAVILHWLIAALIVLNFVLAWSAEGQPRPVRMEIMGHHKAVGLTILALTVLRIGWRLWRKPPPLLPTLRSWEAALARLTHGAFYLLMLAIPLAGWGIVSPSGKPTSLWGLLNVPALPVSAEKASRDFFHGAHEVGATLMLALLVLHVLAVVKHHRIDKDGTLRRMVPFLK